MKRMKSKLVLIVMLIALVATMLSACAISASNFTAEVPSEKVEVASNVGGVAIEPDSIQTYIAKQIKNLPRLAQL